MTSVDFGLLDTANIKPLGIYGSRSEIVKYLQDLSCVNNEVSVAVVAWFASSNVIVVLAPIFCEKGRMT